MAILRLVGLASCRCRPLSSNVSPFMTRLYILRALAVLVGIIGAVSAIGSFTMQGMPPVQQVVTPINGVLLIFAAWLLLQRKRLAPLLLLVSAAAYFLSYAWPSALSNGPSALTMFMPAFYYSVVTRVALAAIAYWLVKSLVPNESLRSSIHIEG